MSDRRVRGKACQDEYWDTGLQGGAGVRRYRKRGTWIRGSITEGCWREKKEGRGLLEDVQRKRGQRCARVRKERKKDVLG